MSVELIGMTQNPINVVGSQTRIEIELATPALEKLIASFARTPANIVSVPHTENYDRVYLKLENIAGKSGATLIDIYVGLPENGNPKEHPELKAETVSLYGISQASEHVLEDGSSGINVVVDVTDILYKRYQNQVPRIKTLPIRLIPRHPVDEVAELRIGRLSILREFAS